MHSQRLSSLSLHCCSDLDTVQYRTTVPSPPTPATRVRTNAHMEPLFNPEPRLHVEFDLKYRWPNSPRLSLPNRPSHTLKPSYSFSHLNSYSRATAVACPPDGKRLVGAFRLQEWAS